MAINAMLNSGNKQNHQYSNNYQGNSGGLGGIASSLLGGSSHGSGHSSSSGLGALGSLLGGSSHNKPYGQPGQQMPNQGGQYYGGGAPGQHPGGSGSGLSGIFNAVTVSKKRLCPRTIIDMIVTGT